MKVVAVVTARMASTRLPGKTLLPIGGRPMLLRVFDRLSLCETLDSIVVATTHQPENRVIQKVCEREGIGCVVANLPDEDVVGRLREACAATSADAIVRVTPDCPLIDAALVDRVIEGFTGSLSYALKLPADYSSNVFPRRSYPDGLDAELLSQELLSVLPHAEDVTRYVWEHPERFRIWSVEQAEDLSKLNWTVNYLEDLEFVRWVYERLPEGFSWREVLALHRREGQIRELVTLDTRFLDGRFP